MRAIKIILFSFITLFMINDVSGNDAYHATIEGPRVAFSGESLTYQVNIVPAGTYTKSWKAKIGEGTWGNSLGSGATLDYNAPSEITSFTIKCDITGHDPSPELNATTFTHTSSGPSYTYEGEASTSFTISFQPENLTIDNHYHPIDFKSQI